MKLNPVYNTATISPYKVYQIDGVSYRFVHQIGDGKNIKYVFEPLQKQRTKTQLILNQMKLGIRCMEVEGMIHNPSAVESEPVQKGLF
ncbi:MAG: hypothetical protein RMY28_031215 [Nostoc sp. ChiSLP01]|nr:hypothetical protein [Nostoc sp. CmiSLP01]MDZ8288434.1 hypothetical protein [Nostoc sp. ChiSLP01]